MTSLVMEMTDYVEDETAGLSDQMQRALAVLQDMFSTTQENIIEDGRNQIDARVEVKEWYSRMEALKVFKKGSSRQARNNLKNKLKNEGLIYEKDGFVFPEEAKKCPE